MRVYAPGSPVVWDAAKGAHFSLAPIRVLVQRCFQGPKRWGHWQIGISGGIKGMYFFLLGTPHLWIPPTGPQAPHALCTPQPYTSPTYGLLLVLGLASRESELSQIASERAQKAGPIYSSGRDHKLER